MKDEKQYTEGISTKDNKFLSWLDNYWYHYKWVTLIVAFFVIVFAICIVQSCTTEVNDINVTYAGPVALSASDKAAIESALSKELNKEFSSEADAGLLSFYILSKDQITELEKETHADGDYIYVDRSFISSEMDSFESQLQSGSGSVLLLDPSIYRSIVGETGVTQFLKPLSEVFGKTPEGALDAYSVRLGDTEMYQNSPALRCLPEDTVLCLYEKLIFQKGYDNEIAAFKAFAPIASAPQEKE